MEQLLSLLFEWIRELQLFELDANTIPKVLTILTVLSTITQGVKKGVEWLSRADWVTSKLPFLASALKTLAHGAGPKILNVVLTFTVMGAAALEDGAFSGGEAYHLLGVVLATFGIALGNDMVYQVTRKTLYPKS